LERNYRQTAGRFSRILFRVVRFPPLRQEETARMGLQNLLIEKIAVDLVIANLKENRLSAVAPPRPMLESRCEQVETYADVSTARRIGIMSHYCPALGTAKNLPNLVQNGGFSDVWVYVTPLFS
jgi:hypothetical protein